LHSPPYCVDVTRIGAGAARALSAGATGHVVVAFSRATYVRTPRGLVAFTPPGTHPGPLHAVLAEPIPPLATGTPVHVDASCVVMGDAVVMNLVTAERWTGHHPEPSALRAARRLACQAVAPVVSRAALLSEPWVGATEGWLAALAGGDLERVARLLWGVGPGLTPSGDDALAGVLLVARLLWGVAAEARLLRCVALDGTSELSIAFLLWAARGQSLAPVHDLLRAAVEGRRGDALQCAHLLAQVGASSGADLCLGMQRALDHLPAM
jgi:hypothetical protein